MLAQGGFASFDLCGCLSFASFVPVLTLAAPYLGF